MIAEKLIAQTSAPDGTDMNIRLYEDRGLAIAFDALRSGGVLAIWSAREDRKFEQRLRYAGFAVEVQRARGRLKKGRPHHTIFLARKNVMTERNRAGSS
jgi:hypothetical protein